ncbi:MAG TPA: hypothetical protein VHS78_05150 [Candidatus Elarobacter sp.]|jgi:hypothetical protein|nr:hypothetical protein [Candidatus Elarobacter sp.]
MRALRVLLCVLAVVAALRAERCAAADAANADPRTTAATVAHDMGVQDRLPSESAPPPHARPDESQGGWRRGEGPAPAAPSASAGVFSQALLWGAVALVAVFIAATVLDAVGSRRAAAARARGDADDGDPSSAAARAAAPRGRLTTADELAAAGRYTEAIHQLLSDALAMLRRRIGGELSDALTSREILRMTKLRAAEQDALGAIVARVEQTWFAQRVAAAVDYDAVRESFRIFSAAETGGG